MHTQYEEEMIAKSRKIADDLEQEMGIQQINQQWPQGTPMDVHKYMDKHPHLKQQMDEQSQHSVQTTNLKPSDIQNLIQATASKKNQLDVISQGEIDDTKFEEF